ncbi:MAG: signal recognition particle-docking protein FtsY [Desulfovibrio sp.]|jgi:fused signal recognition particle receptor|nr:signal recognition particle-docking protein FtsY [Desulfovibrio sp.]
MRLRPPANAHPHPPAEMGFFSSLRKFFDASPERTAPFSGASAESADAPSAFSPEEAAMLVKLRACDARLSAWLEVILKDVDGAGDLLYSRIAFLLAVLEAPEAERRDFVRKFRSWLEDMEYESLEDFRSELQYRLALALDLEDEEDERSRLLLKLAQGLSGTRERIAGGLNRLFLSGRAVDGSFWEELEETLILADTGFETAHRLTEKLRGRAAAEGITDTVRVRAALHEELLKLFKPVHRISAVNPPEVVLVIGVNGAGKTTTIAKLCHREVLRGKKTLLAAADTFRAAAVEQLEIWAARAGAAFHAGKQGADPAAVTYEALQKGLRDGCDVIFVDTAGRLHTKTNLMDELGKICRAAGKAHPGAPHRTVLVLDAGSGQNTLNQIRMFSRCCGIDELILTKLDGTARGGTAVAAAAFGIPVSFVGMGEKMEDLRPFDPESFVSALLAPAS